MESPCINKASIYLPNQNQLNILFDEGPTLETLDFTIRIGSTLNLFMFRLYIYSAYAAHNVYFTMWIIF